MTSGLSSRPTTSVVFYWYHLLVLCSIPMTAALITFGRVHDDQNGDTLVPVLMSLHRWTPFFWDQARFGMLVPLLAMPVRDPFANMLVQTFLCSLAAVSVPFLLARYLFPRQLTFVIGATAMGVCMMTQGMPVHSHMLMLSDQPYSVGMCLTLLGVLLLESESLTTFGMWRRCLSVIVSVVLIFLGAWVNMAIVFSLGPLIFRKTLYQHWLEPNRLSATSGPCVVSPGETTIARLWKMIVPWGGVIALVSSVAILGLLSRWAPNSPKRLISDPSQWSKCWLQLAINFYNDILSFPMLCTMAVLTEIGVVGYLIRRKEAAIRQAATASLLLVLTSVTTWLLIGMLVHIQDNGYATRYLTDGLVMLNLACVGLAVCVLFLNDKPDAQPTRGWTPTPVHVLSLTFLVGACIFRFGPPSLVSVHQALEKPFGKNVDAVERIRATHIAGNYWTVWPTMFLYETRSHESDTPQVIWGIAHRTVFLPALGDDDVRIAVKSGQSKDAEYYLRNSGMWPCERTEAVGDFEVWRIKNESAAFEKNWGTPEDGKSRHWCDQWGTFSLRSSIGGQVDLVLNLESRNWPIRLTAKIDAGTPVSVDVEQGGFHTVVFRGMPMEAGTHSIRIEGTDLQDSKRRPWITVESGYVQFGDRKFDLE